MEVYNGTTHDLLSATPTKKLKLRTESDSYEVVDLTRHPIASVENGLALVKLGNKMRSTSR